MPQSPIVVPAQPPQVVKPKLPDSLYKTDQEVRTKRGVNFGVIVAVRFEKSTNSYVYKIRFDDIGKLIEMYEGEIELR